MEPPLQRSLSYVSHFKTDSASPGFCNGYQMLLLGLGQIDLCKIQKYLTAEKHRQPIKTCQPSANLFPPRADLVPLGAVSYIIIMR